MYPHLIPMAVYLLACQPQGPPCLSIALRRKLNTKGEISNRISKVRNELSSSATYGPPYEPPLHPTHVFQEELFWRKVSRTPPQSPPNASLSCTLQNLVLRSAETAEASWNVFFEGLIWIPASLFITNETLSGHLRGALFPLCKWERTMPITLGCLTNEISWRMWKFFQVVQVS